MLDLTKNPWYRKALSFIATEDLSALPTGKHILDGENLYVNIVDATLKEASAAKFETHDAYIDIQVPLSGCESYGVKPRSACEKPVGTYEPVKDIQCYADEIVQIVSCVPGEPITFTPDVAHAPTIGSGTLRKAIFKVKVV